MSSFIFSEKSKKKNEKVIEFYTVKTDLFIHHTVTAVQRTRLGTTNAAEILLKGKTCKFNVSFILTEISRISFSGGYGISTGCVFVVLSNFKL